MQDTTKAKLPELQRGASTHPKLSPPFCLVIKEGMYEEAQGEDHTPEERRHAERRRQVRMDEREPWERERMEEWKRELVKEPQEQVPAPQEQVLLEERVVHPEREWARVQRPEREAEQWRR